MKYKSIIFIHIPKCAGSSFGLKLTSLFKEKTFWHGHSGKYIINSIEELGCEDFLTQYNFIGGHFTWNCISPLLKLPTQEPLVITIIRNPVDQVWSYFNWIKIGSVLAGSPHPYNKMCSELSLTEAILITEIKNELSNVQCRYFFGNPNIDFRRNNILEILKKRKTIIVTLDNINVLSEIIHKDYFDTGNTKSPYILNEHQYTVGRENKTKNKVKFNDKELECMLNISKNDLYFYNIIKNDYNGIFINE